MKGRDKARNNSKVCSDMGLKFSDDRCLAKEWRRSVLSVVLAAKGLKRVEVRSPSGLTKDNVDGTQKEEKVSKDVDTGFSRRMTAG